MRERFLREAPASWAKYRAFAATLQGGYHCEWMDALNDNKPLFAGGRQIKQRGSYQLRIIRNPDSTTETLQAMNDHYAFELSRDSADAPWLVRGLELDKTGPIASSFEKEPVCLSACVLLQVGLLYLPELLTNQYFTLGEVRPIWRGDEELARMEFEFTPPSIENQPVRGGWVLLDPARYWIVREFELKAEWPEAYEGRKITAVSKGSISKVNSFRMSKEGFPIPTRNVRSQQGTYKADPVHLKSISENTWREDVLPAETEFTLTAFGFPEPGQRPKSRTFP